MLVSCFKDFNKWINPSTVDRANLTDAWRKFVDILIDSVRDGYVRELKRLDRVRCNLSAAEQHVGSSSERVVCFSFR